MIELIHNHADQHQNEVVLSFDQSLLSSFSLFLLPISFHLNFEALVPRVVIDQLQKLQNRAARIVTNSCFDAPSRPLIGSLGWKTVRELVDQDSRVMVYKSINGLAPQYMSHLFTRNSACSSRNLRNTKTDLRLPMKTSANGQKCFSYRGAKLWNSPSAEIKQAPSFAVFKQNIQ